MSPSFLSVADVTDLTAVNLDGFATLATVYPERTVDVIFARWNQQAETWTSLYPQRVRVEYADRQERQAQTDAGELVTIDGWLIGLAPMDVERGDLFSLGGTGDEERAEIIVVRPAELGLQRAAFRLRLGEQ
jgi:hypothetical protein